MDFQTLLYQLHLAYAEARKNKRNTRNQIAFEIDQEDNLHKLAESVVDRTYEPKPSIAFIVNHPVKREIFAADFSDRVIHHLLYMCIYPDIDKRLINDTYSCRKGKGTYYGINRVKKFIRSCTNNYQQDAYILKLDIKGYFMNIKHQIIYDKMLPSIDDARTYKGIDSATIKYLLKQTIFANVSQNSRIKGSRKDWKGLPPDKSLFNKPDGVGLPIGNLTSQIFGNVYLNDFDHFVKEKLDVKYYGRYVDDMIFVHNNKEFLKLIIPCVQEQIQPLGLCLHPNKTYLQHYSRGLLFLGQYIKPYRTYISNRTKKSLYNAIKEVNRLLVQTETIAWKTMKKIQALLNSYLGILKHANAHDLTKKVIGGLIKRFYNFFYFSHDLSKIYINDEFWAWHYSLTYRFTNQATIC